VSPITRLRPPPPPTPPRTWDGFKTALKPATEFVVVARAPLSEGTVAENVQTHGTGALNIDGTRVEGEEYTYKQDGIPQQTPRENEHTENQDGAADKYHNRETKEVTRTGRYPSNVVFDEQAAAALDREVGELSSGGMPKQRENTGYSGGLDGQENVEDTIGHDSGGPSRYFYTSKATKAERNLGGKINNDHPTVKPTDLMEWLVKLVTAEDQIVVDPFAGSGTTCMAAKNLNRQFIGIEQNAEYADLARVRAGLTPNDPSVVRGDDQQRGFEAFD